MKENLTIILIGLVAAFIGIIPLLRKRADRHSVCSTFLLFFMMPYIVFHFQLHWAQWWWKGMLISGVLSLPLMIALGRGSFKLFLPLLLAAIFVGAFISLVGHYLL